MENLFKIEIPEKRNFGLDLLRFIAIFTVLVSHSSLLLPPYYKFVHKFIFDGVMVFFVLSGFLIGRIFIREFENYSNFKTVIHFWKRRWWRTLPAYYITLFIIIALSIILNKPFAFKEFVKSLFFIQNFFSYNGKFFPEGWSLAIEEWFYLVTPLLTILIFKFSRSIKVNILIMFSLILCFSTFLRFYFFLTIPAYSINDWNEVFRSPVITRLDSILMGVLAAWFFVYKKSFFEIYKNYTFAIGFVIFVVYKVYADYFVTSPNFFLSVIALSLIPFSIMLMLPKFYFLKETKLPFLNKIIAKGSLISYSMYLLNLTVVSQLIIRPLHLRSSINFVLFWTLTVIFSIIMYKKIELPFMRLRDRL